MQPPPSTTTIPHGGRCDIAKASKRARAVLKQHAGVQFYLGLLSVTYWQEHALDALLVWLQDEPAHVTQFIEAPFGLAQLQVVLEARNNTSFTNMLEPLLKILYTSPPINRALGQIKPELGHSPFVSALVRRLQHPNALARRLVLSILTLIYERHQAPKQLVEKHKLEPVLRGIKLSDPGVLVQQMASQLHRSFEAHDVL